MLPAHVLTPVEVGAGGLLLTILVFATEAHAEQVVVLLPGNGKLLVELESFQIFAELIAVPKGCLQRGLGGD